MTYAVLVVTIVSGPKILIFGFFKTFESERAFSLILALQLTVWHFPSQKFTVWSTMSFWAVARVRLFCKSVHTCSSSRAKYIGSRCTLLRTSDFTVFSKIRDIIVLCLGTIAKALIAGDIGVALHSVNASSAIITNMRFVSVTDRADLIFSSASNAGPSIGTVAEPAIP
jgi:glucose uptake protein GlcU